MIEHVRLRNFLSHAESDIDLEDGVNVFIGRNGAGKSSVIDAVTYALFGEHSRGDNRNLVRRGAREGSVEVVFTAGGRRYMAVRRLGADGKLVEAVLKEGADGGSWRTVAAGERRQMGESMRRVVESVLGLDYDRLKVAAIVHQGELDSIVTDYKPSELKELINELIGIDALDAAYDESREVLSGFRGRLRAEYGYDDKELDKVQAEAGLKEAEEELRRAEEELRSLRAEEGQLSAELDSLEEKRRKVELLEEKRRNLIERVESFRRDISDRLRDAEGKIPVARHYLEVLGWEPEIEASIKALEAEDARLRSMREGLAHRLGGLRRIDLKRLEADVEKERARMERLSEEVKRLEAEDARLRSEANPGPRDELEAEDARLDEELRRLDSEIGGLRAKVNDYRKVRETGVCPTCGSTVDPSDMDNRIAEKEGELRRLEGVRRGMEDRRRQLKELLRRATKYEEDMRRLEDVRRGMEDRRRQLKELEDDLREKEEGLIAARREVADRPSVEAEYEGIGRRIEEVNGRLREERARREKVAEARAWLRANDIGGADDVEALRRKAEELKAKLSALPEDPLRAELDLLRLDEESSKLVDEIKALEAVLVGFSQERYEEVRGKLEEVRSKIGELERRRGEVEGRAKGLSDDLQRLEAAARELGVAQIYAQLLERIRDNVYNRDGPVATSLRSWALGEISRRASDYIRLFSIGISSIELRDERRDVKMICYSGSGERDVKSMSGGEKVALALALRFAMADLMGKGRVDFVVLDEPTTHLDSERRRSLVDLISRLNRAQEQGNISLSQIIIITHDKEVFEDSDVNSVLEFEASPGGTRVRPIQAD